MAQNPAERPVPSFQRKAAIASGAAVDHRGAVKIAPIKNFDLDKTIFKTLEGRLPRFVMRTRVGKEPKWEAGATTEIDKAYAAADVAAKLPALDPALLRFLVEECDFDVEHADGSFLDHLYFCFEYGALHYPGGSPLVLLLHSILGTGTNTFAMKAEKIPTLKAMLPAADWTQIESFPSVLRLLYDLPLRRELRANVDKLPTMKAIKFRRVIDNAPLSLTGPEFLTALNYQLIHLVDFLPVANWPRHANDTAFIIFRDLYDLMERSKTRVATVKYAPESVLKAPEPGPESLATTLTTMIPVGVSEKMAARAVRTWSQRIGHDISYAIEW